MPEERNFIGEYLLKKGVISRKQLEEAFEEQNRTNAKIGEIIVRRGFAKEEDVAKALAEQLGFAFVDLYSYKVDTAVLTLIPAQVALRLEAMPLFKVGDSLTVAMANPLDVDRIDEIGRLSGARIKPAVAAPSAINEAIKRHYGKKAEEKQQVEKETDRLIEEAEQEPVINIVNRVIEDAVKADASDIHLEPQGDNFYCRLRIDGILHKVPPLPKELQLAIVSRIKIMAGMDIAQSRLPQDGRIVMKASGRDIDLRVTTFPTIYGEHVSIRILDKSQGIIKLEELGFQADTLKKFKETIERPYGLVLVTGPTGSGKTTTLYSVLNTINVFTKNIITLEDPVEYTISNVHQSQVNAKAGLTFSSGLRSIVRLDPDIIMIGEIRDKDTADIAVQASLTGHLVFSTLHTNDAASAVNRLLDIGVEPYLLSSSLVGILAQRLVRKLCPKCKVEYKPNQEEMEIIKGNMKNISAQALFYKAGACEHCKDAGYKGRTGIFELIVPDENIKELITKRAPAYEIKSVAVKSGMKVLREDGLEKVAQGITSLSEVIRVTEEV
jgi:type IV pilus assembly protein PilB